MSSKVKIIIKGDFWYCSCTLCPNEWIEIDPKLRIPPRKTIEGSCACTFNAAKYEHKKCEPDCGCSYEKYIDEN